MTKLDLLVVSAVMGGIIGAYVLVRVIVGCVFWFIEKLEAPRVR